MDKFSQQRIQIRGVTENRRRAICTELGVQFNRDPCFCPVDSVSLGAPGEPKSKSQGSGKCFFSSVAFLVTGIGVNQAKKHTQIIGKIKRASADLMLQPELSAYCKAELGYASNEFEVLYTRENQVSVAEHWVS